jgi:hypothetical protein
LTGIKQAGPGLTRSDRQHAVPLELHTRSDSATPVGRGQSSGKACRSHAGEVGSWCPCVQQSRAALSRRPPGAATGGPPAGNSSPAPRPHHVARWAPRGSRQRPGPDAPPVAVLRGSFAWASSRGVGAGCCPAVRVQHETVKQIARHAAASWHSSPCCAWCGTLNALGCRWDLQLQQRVPGVCGAT